MTNRTMWVKIEEVDFDLNTPTMVVAKGRALCVTRTAEGWGILDNRCPHQGGPLGEGHIEDGCLLCPWHGYEFELRGGACAGGGGPRLFPPPELVVDPGTGRARLVRKAD